MFKKTKIVATIGPATEDKKMLENLALAGVDAVRMNFSHGDFAEHQKRLDSVRSVLKFYQIWRVLTQLEVFFIMDLALKY